MAYMIGGGVAPQWLSECWVGGWVGGEPSSAQGKKLEASEQGRPVMQPRVRGRLETPGELQHDSALKGCHLPFLLLLHVGP